LLREKTVRKKEVELKSQLGGSQVLSCVNEVHYWISFEAVLHFLHFAVLPYEPIIIM